MFDDHLITPLWTDESGSEPSADCDDDCAEKRWEKTRHVKSVKQPGNETEHACVDHEQEKAQGDQGDRQGQQDKQRANNRVDYTQQHRSPREGDVVRDVHTGNDGRGEPEPERRYQSPDQETGYWLNQIVRVGFIVISSAVEVSPKARRTPPTP